MPAASRDQKGPPSHQVFISYSRKDKEFVRRLDEELKRRGREAWVDWEGIPPGDKWEKTIYGAIEATDTFIFVITPDSVASDVCGKELAHAAANNKRLVPIVHRDVEAGRVPESLRELNWIFFRDSDDFDKATDTLISAIDTDLNWVRAHTRLLTRAIEWDANNRNNSFVLRGEDLRAAERWLAEAGAQKERQPTALQTEYIIASRKASARRQRITLGAVTFGFVIAIVLAILAIFAAKRASAQKRETQRLLVASDSNRAEDLFSKDNGSSALVFLARAVQQDPDNNSTAADRLWFALTERSWPLPLSPPMRHQAKILSACFSPDGSKILTASQDTVRVWDANSGNELRVLKHPKLVRQAIFTPDGRFIVTICSDAKARLWNAGPADTGTPGTTATPTTTPFPNWTVQHDSEVNSVDVDSKGRYVATGSADQTVRVWDLTDGKPIARMSYDENVHIVAFDPSDDTLLLSVSGNTATLSKLPEGHAVFEFRHEAAINSAEFNPKGDRIVTADEDGVCRLWDVSTGNIRGELKHDAEVISAIFSPDGEIIATLSGLELCLWQIGETPACKQRLTHDNPVTHARFSRDGLVIFSATNEGKVQSWNVVTGQPVGDPIREDGDPLLDLDSQGKRLLVATAKGMARAWRPAPRYPIGDRFVHSAGIESLSVSPNGRLLLTTSSDNTACLWNLARRNAPPRQFHEGGPLCGGFSADSKYIAIGNADGTARLWLVDSGESFGQSLQAGGPVAKIAFSPDGKLLATATDEGIAQFWDLGSLAQKGKPMTHSPGITSIEFKADGKLFLTVGADSKVQCWEVGTGEPVRTPVSSQTDFTCARFSPNKDVIATGSRGGTVQIWPVTSGDPVDVPFYDYRAVTDISYSPDGRYLAIASESGQVMVLDAATWRSVGTPMHLVSPVSVVEFTRDSSRIATACKDGTVQLWDTATGRVLSEQLHQLKSVCCLGFSPDNDTLFSGSADRTVQTYDVKTSLTSADRESLAGFARAISSVSLLDSGITEPHLIEKVDSLRVTAKSFSVGTRTLTDWFFAEPAHRLLTPFSRIDLSAYIDCRAENDPDGSTYEKLYYSSGDLAPQKQLQSNLQRSP